MLKVMEFDSVEAYEASNASSKYEVVTIVKNGNQICADLLTCCKRYQTALRRFFTALEGHGDFCDWQETLRKACEAGTFQEGFGFDGKYAGDYHWCVEERDDACYYIELTVCDDDAAEAEPEPRPEGLPADIPWYGWPTDEEPDPYVYDGGMSLEDYELMSANQLADESTPTQANAVVPEMTQVNPVNVAAKPLDDSYTLVATIALPALEPLAKKWEPP